MQDDVTSHLEYFGPLLLLWNEEAEGPEFVVWNCRSPAGRVRDRSRLAINPLELKR
jgi:hypothetical protein